MPRVLSRVWGASPLPSEHRFCDLRLALRPSTLHAKPPEGSADRTHRPNGSAWVSLTIGASSARSWKSRFKQRSSAMGRQAEKICGRNREDASGNNPDSKPLVSVGLFFVIQRDHTRVLKNWNMEKLLFLRIERSNSYRVTVHSLNFSLWSHRARP